MTDETQETPPAVVKAARATDDQADAREFARVRTLQTIGGIIIGCGAAAVGVVLVLRNAPVSAWATAFGIALVGAGILHPSTVKQWIVK